LAQVCRTVPQNSTHCCNVAILGTVDTFGTEELLLDHKKSFGATSCQLPQFEKLGMIMMEKTCSEVAGAACYFDTHLHIYDIITV